MVASPEQEGQNPSQATADQVAQAAVAAGARVFVLQAAGNTLAGNPAELQEPMITLARETGGEYVELNVGRDYVNDARAAFGRIRRPDYAYKLTYRSADGTPGERRLSVALAGQPELAVEQTVSVAVAPPAADEANLAIDPALDGRRQIRVPIAWPDDFSPRAIRAVTLNGEPIETFDLADGVLTFSIDEMITGDLRLVIEDEVGQTAQLVIQIATPPSPTPTSAPPTATPTPAVVPVAPPSRFTGVWPWLAVLAVAIVAAAAYLGMRRGTLSHIGQGIGEGARRIATIGTAREEKQALAYLLVLTGRDNLIGQNVPLYNEITTIGRDPQLTDIQLYDVSELSSISGQHCTIQVDHGLFLIIDNNSSNGTYVNGEALTPDLPHQLQNGDEIVLGDKARHGAQLRFEISRRALNRFSHTVIDGEWQGGERSGTATTPGPTRGLDRLDDLWPPDEASAEPPAASTGQAE
jgi:pSer/pThr/pTyr-binding forkhead associated (FHA) protein